MLIAINAAERLIMSDQTGQDVAHQLVDDSRDILAIALDGKVSFSSKTCHYYTGTHVFLPVQINCRPLYFPIPCRVLGRPIL